jgi:hypothetical protein
MKPSSRSVLSLAGRSAGALALLGAGYIARNWYRYGKVQRVGGADALLDRFIPVCDVREYHSTRVAAPVDIAYEAARAMEINRSWLVRGIFRLRELAMGAGHVETPAPRPLVEEAQALGWGVLAEAEHEIVFGAVTQPWQADVRFESVPPEEFQSFSRPGYVKIAFTIGAEPLDARSSIVRTETRVATTDGHARERFRRYWTLVSPGVRVIRLEMLRLVRADAERRARPQSSSNA